VRDAPRADRRCGAESGTRTRTALRQPVFATGASTDSAMSAVSNQHWYPCTPWYLYRFIPISVSLVTPCTPVLYSTSFRSIARSLGVSLRAARRPSNESPPSIIMGLRWNRPSWL
jgi:hypothetical protein